MGVGKLYLPFLMVELAGIVLAPSTEDITFTNPQQIRDLFDLIERPREDRPESSLTVQTSDLWLPTELILRERARATRGDVFRVDADLFRHAFGFRGGRIEAEDFSSSPGNRRRASVIGDRDRGIYYSGENGRRLGTVSRGTIPAEPERPAPMSTLSVTFIDVGWGDSILIESEQNGVSQFALVDSNDSVHERSSFLFLKRFFERRHLPFARPQQIFEFVLLTHAHADHASGLPRVLSKFGAKRFLYPQSHPHALLSQIIRYSRHPRTRLSHAQTVDSSTAWVASLAV